MNRSRSQIDASHLRNLTLHKPGVIPNACRNQSPISSNHHKYELKQKIWPKQTIESWFANHSTDERRAVYSFLNTLYENNGGDDDYRHQKTRSPSARHYKTPQRRFSSRLNTPLINSSNISRHESRASKRDLGEVLESLESYRNSPSTHERAIQTTATPIIVPLPNVNGVKIDEKQSRRPKTSVEKYSETIQPQNSTENPPVTNDDDNKQIGRRYLSHSWRVINPREDVEPNIRPEHNISSFFNYTKKVYPEYFFIHPDWY